MSRLSGSRVAITIVTIMVFAFAAPARAQGREAFVRAVVEFVNVVNDAPGDAARLNAAVEAMAAGLAEWDAAIARAEAGFKADIGGAPPAAAVRMRGALGVLYLERGRTMDALAQLDAASTVPGAPPQIHVFRGWALRAAGRIGEAAVAFERAFSASRDPASAYLALHYARMAGRPERAGDAAAAVRALEPDPSRGETGAAPFVRPALLDDAAARDPVLPPAAFARAYALLQEGRYGEAVAALRAAVSTGAASAAGERARITAAESLAARGLPEQAEQALVDLIRATPASAQARWHLGVLYQRLNRERDALEQFEAAAASNPLAGAAALHVLIGQLHENQLDADRAVQSFVRAVDIDLNHAAAHRELAEALQALDRLDEAHTEFVVSLRIDPANAVAWTGLGQLHAAQGRMDAALAAFQRAVTLDARNREARYALARALLQAGRKEDGERELAVFETLQAEAMAEERRRYEENLRRIDASRQAPPVPGR